MNLTLRKFFAVTTATLTAVAATAEVVTNDYIEVDGVQHADWGYTIQGIGDGGDFALVFTKTSEAMTWTPPSEVTNISYLAVAGGGAGGKSNTSTPCAGGGGGAGGMLVGTYDITDQASFSITVGAGGVNANGGNSVIVYGETEIAKAIGGGKGGDGNGAVGNTGGSGGGSGWKKTTGGSGTPGQGHDGGGNTTSNGNGGGAGGGGAGSVGTSNSGVIGATGGAGLLCDITGENIYYAGGGGGGGRNSGGAAGGQGGGGQGGKGNGTTGVTATCGTAGADGLGSGGGGSGRGYTSGGGKGGNGIVVIRYAGVTGTPVTAPAIEAVTYDGDTHTPVVATSEDYEVVTLPQDCVNAGEYDVVLSLVGTGKYWEDYYTTADLTLKFVINKVSNSWVAEPSLSTTSWEYSEAAAEVSMGEASSGTVAVTYIDANDNESGTMPTSVGSYTARFVAYLDDNHETCTKDIAFTIAKDTNSWIVDPVLPSLSVEDGEYAAFIPPTAKYGNETMICYYDNNPSTTERPTSAFANHSVTYEVPAGTTYTSYKRTYQFKIGYKQIFDLNDPSKAYGYRITGLGDNQNEVALVFTNLTYNSDNRMSYRIPDDVTSIRYLVVGGGGSGGTHAGSSYYGCGGGGAGALLEGTCPLTGEQAVTIDVVVGKGGAAQFCTSSGTAKNGQNGQDSLLLTNGVDFVTAYGGGGGGKGNSAGLDGGSGGGSGGVFSTSVPLAAGGTLGSGGNPGGTGSYNTTKNTTNGGGGGGGAGGAGSSCGSGTKYGAAGGAGVTNNITGTWTWYAAGGGGGSCSTSATSGGAGGTSGGGKGGDKGANGGNATTYGSGGGGSSGTGGNDSTGRYSGSGYQGIVVVRYTESKPQNFWTVDPAISKDSWLSGDDSVVLTAGMTKYGAPAATVSVDGGSAEPFDGEIPTVPGDYVVTYDMSSLTDYYPDQVVTKSISFTVLPGDEVPPFSVSATSAPAYVVRGTQVDIDFAYAVSCDVQSAKLVDIHALYWYDGSETNDVELAHDVALDATGSYTIENVAINTNCYVCLYGFGGNTYSPTSQVYTVNVPGPASITASATFTNNPKEFVISGNVVPGLGTTTVKLYWSLNSSALDNTNTYVYAFGDDGHFSTNIAYESYNDYLVWKIDVSNTFGTDNWETGIAQKTRTRADTSTIKYTWKGGSAGDWCDSANWTPSSTPCYGYPNSDYAQVAFGSSSHVVNLGGASIITESGNKTTSFAIGGHLVITNGTLRLPYQCVSTGKHIEFRDGGILTDVGTGGTLAGSLVFAQNGDGGEVTLGGDAAVNSTYFGAWYNGPNDVVSYGTNYINTQTVYCRGGVFRMFAFGKNSDAGYLRIKNFQNGSWTSATGGGAVYLTVSNAVISANNITWNPYGKERLELNYFVPANGFETAPIQLRDNGSDLEDADTRLTLKFEDGFNDFARDIPLMSGVSDINMGNLRSHITVIPAKLQSRFVVKYYGRTLYGRVKSNQTMLILQ